MKKVLLLVFALLISIVFVTTGIAAPDKPDGQVEKKDKVAKPRTMKFGGEVVKVEASQVTVKGREKGKATEKTFDVTTARFKGYKDAGEIKPGDKIGVLFVEPDGKAIAKTVAKLPPRKPVKKEERKEDRPAEKPPEAPAKK